MQPATSHNIARAALLVFLPVLNGCAAISAAFGRFQDPQLIIHASKVDQFSPSTLSVTIDVEVYNPNSYELFVKQLQYSLVVGDKVLVEGELAEGFALGGGGSESRVLPIEISLNRLISAAKDTLTMGEVPYELRATLSLAAMLVEREITLGGSSVLRINLPLGLARLSNPPAQT